MLVVQLLHFLCITLKLLSPLNEEIRAFLLQTSSKLRLSVKYAEVICFRFFLGLLIQRKQFSVNRCLHGNYDIRKSQLSISTKTNNLFQQNQNFEQKKT